MEEGYRSAIERVSFTCGKRISQQTTEIKYTKNMGQGVPIGIDNSVKAPEHIQPGKIFDDVYNILCKL